MNQTLPQKVSKENIPTLNFIASDILENELEKQQRNEKLIKAMVVGNTYRQKVEIVFFTTDGPKSVETTVWASTDQNILLKDGINLPIRSVKEINMAA